jgi:hypothetical protein
LAVQPRNLVQTIGATLVKLRFLCVFGARPSPRPHGLYRFSLSHSLSLSSTYPPTPRLPPVSSTSHASSQPLLVTYRVSRNGLSPRDIVLSEFETRLLGNWLEGREPRRAKKSQRAPGLGEATPSSLAFAQTQKDAETPEPGPLIASLATPEGIPQAASQTAAQIAKQVNTI